MCAAPSPASGVSKAGCYAPAYAWLVPHLVPSVMTVKIRTSQRLWNQDVCHQDGSAGPDTTHVALQEGALTQLKRHFVLTDIFVHWQC